MLNFVMSEHELEPMRLIELVKNTPIIWDRSSTSYKKKGKTKEAWTKICREIWNKYDKFDHAKKDHLAQLAKKKWNNIRDNWHKSKRIEEKLKEMKVPRRSKKYVFQNLLLFLDETPSTPCSTDHIKIETSEEDISEVGEPLQTHVDPFEEESLNSQTDPLPTQPGVVPTLLYQPCEDRHLMFFKSIVPSLQTFTEDQIIDFQLGVLQLIRQLKTTASHLSTPNPPNFSTFEYSAPLPTTSMNDRLPKTSDS